MITIDHWTVERTDLLSGRYWWQHHVVLNCHGIAAFEVEYSGATREDVEAKRDFMHRGAELVAEWWELDNCPWH